MSTGSVNWVRAQRGLTQSERNVLMSLAWQINDLKKEDFSCPYIKDIADEVELKINTVKKVLSSLVKKRFLLIQNTYKKDGSFDRSLYRMNFSRAQIEHIENVLRMKPEEFEKSQCCDCKKPQKLSHKSVDKPVDKDRGGGSTSTTLVDSHARNRPSYLNIKNTNKNTSEETTKCNFFGQEDKSGRKCTRMPSLNFEGSMYCEEHYHEKKEVRYQRKRN